MTQPLLQVRDLTVSYGGLRAVDGFSMKIDPGAIVGLIGPNGAGKTTFIDALTGFTPFTGDVEFDGSNLNRLAPHQRARRGLSRTFQSLELFEDLTVRENLQSASLGQKWWSVFADLLIPRRAGGEDANTTWAMDILDLKDVADELPDELSHGRRKLVSVARALVMRPRMLLLDEPAAGLSSADSLEFGRELTRLRDSGITIFLVDHDMGLVLSTCDYVYVLEFGRLVAEGAPAQIRRDPRVIAAYLGAHAEAQLNEVADVQAQRSGTTRSGSTA